MNAGIALKLLLGIKGCVESWMALQLKENNRNHCERLSVISFSQMHCVRNNDFTKMLQYRKQSVAPNKSNYN